MLSIMMKKKMMMMMMMTMMTMSRASEATRPPADEPLKLQTRARGSR